MSKVKTLVKKCIPGAAFVWRKLYALYKAKKSQRTRLVFTEKYIKNSWGSVESVSGFGSELKQTQGILRELPDIFLKYEIKTILDIPCGDFNWMKHLKYDFEEYIGADIVGELIEINNDRYSSYGKFKVLNLIKDPLPTADLIFCRDCLVHLSYKDISLAIKNIKRSGAKYLMTTTFLKHTNKDILTGDWRQLNLESLPFSFPAPLEILNEDSDEPGNRNDKCLALWYIKDLK